jgi:hypothetical protein
MAKYSTFEQLPVEIVELCLEGLPASSIAALLGLRSAANRPGGLFQFSLSLFLHMMRSAEAGWIGWLILRLASSRPHISRQTRHLVLTSIEFIFAKMLKSFEENKQYIGVRLSYLTQPKPKKKKI